MEQRLTIKQQNQEIGFSDLDNENEMKISTIDVDCRRTVVWLSTENIISLKKHIDYLVSKILNEPHECEPVHCNEQAKKVCDHEYEEKEANYGQIFNVCIHCGKVWEETD